MVPLAVGAVALVCGSMAFASNLIQDASGDRYAVEIIKNELDKLV